MTPEILVLGVVCGLLIANQIIHWRERGELLDRLMARNFPELVTFQKERATVKEDPRDKAGLVQL